MYGEGAIKDAVKAMNLYHDAAEMGSGYGNFVLGSAYAYGKHGVTVDLKKARQFAERAVKLNFLPARTTLAYLEAKKGRHARSIRHYRLGAEAGYKAHMDTLWGVCNKGGMSKEDLEDTLRKYHQACDDMKSEERERYNAWKKAKKESDLIVRGMYDKYYRGEFNANQLKMAVKLWQNGQVLFEPIPIKK